MRWHVEWSLSAVGVALWVQWRAPHRPVVYAFWSPITWRRLFR